MTAPFQPCGGQQWPRRVRCSVQVSGGLKRPSANRRTQASVSATAIRVYEADARATPDLSSLAPSSISGESSHRPGRRRPCAADTLVAYASSAAFERTGKADKQSKRAGRNAAVARGLRLLSAQSLSAPPPLACSLAPPDRRTCPFTRLRVLQWTRLRAGKADGPDKRAGRHAAAARGCGC